ncbi:MAG: HTH domain-containing protein, partial [Candidatus Gottesmanbacteria bacterium]|nr:HTH domain-containing protein [Candidatus Gottesmanbacteria bacterium]
VGRPLHYREITDIAIKKGLLVTEGRTPWATMNAQLSMDIVTNAEQSLFIRHKPGYYFINQRADINKKYNNYIQKKHIHYNKDGNAITKIYNFPISNNLSTKQKGDVAEARVAELITIYGKEGLSCYKPISDDEGIDLIVKRKRKFEIVYVQVKSTYGFDRNRGFVSTVKEKSLANKEKYLLVFVFYDLTQGDLFDQIFCIPSPDFLRLTQNDKKKTGDRVFTVGLNHPDKSKYNEFMIEKRELANRIIEIMDKL